MSGALDLVPGILAGILRLKAEAQQAELERLRAERNRLLAWLETRAHNMRKPEA